MEVGFQDNKLKKTRNDPDAKVIDEYELFNNNCTTKAIEAVNYKHFTPIVPSETTTLIHDHGENFEYKDKIISPLVFQKQLEKAAKEQPNDIIKIRNPQWFIRNLQKILK